MGRTDFPELRSWIASGWPTNHPGGADSAIVSVMAMLRQLTNQGNRNKIVRTFQVRCLWRETQSRLERRGEYVRPSGTLSANRLACLLAPCVVAALWYGQRHAFHHSLQEIWTAAEQDPGFGKRIQVERGRGHFFDTKDKALVVTNIAAPCCGATAPAAPCTPRPPWRMAWFISARMTTTCTR